MKILFILCLVSAFTVIHAETFYLGNKMNPAVVSVEEKQNMLQIACRFKAQKKFSSDANARFNERKADSLCKQAVMLYMRMPKGQSVSLSGIATAAPHKEYGQEVEYFFTMPAPVMNQIPRVSTVQHTQPQTTKKIISSTANQSAQNLCVAAYQQKGSLTVIRYKEQNGSCEMIETKKYLDTDFDNKQAFDHFCDEQFADINRRADENVQRIMKNFEQNRQRILDGSSR